MICWMASRVDGCVPSSLSAFFHQQLVLSLCSIFSGLYSNVYRTTPSTSATMGKVTRKNGRSFQRCLCLLLVLSLRYPSCHAFLGRSPISTRLPTPFPHLEISPAKKAHTRIYSGAHDGPIARAIQKFRNRPGTHLMIPLIAAFVGWFTNWLAVQMIFYPIEFRGIPLYRRREVPLGLLGWQGIIPCKTRPMTQVMVHM